jgi:hypothetical protein
MRPSPDAALSASLPADEIQIHQEALSGQTFTTR